MWDPNYAASCKMSWEPPVERTVNENAPKVKLTDDEHAAAIGVTTEKLLKMRAFANDLRRRNPKMKEDRIKRKTAEYFKIKLI